jgi:hypothetical protein
MAPSILLLALLLPVMVVQQLPGPGRTSLTPAQKKIDSQLLQEIRRRADPAYEPGTPPIGRVRVDAKARALVDVRVEVTPAILGRVAELGGAVRSSSVVYRSVVAWLPFSQIETLADEQAVIAIGPSAEPVTNK